MKGSNRAGDLLLKVGELQNLPPIVNVDELLDARVEMIDVAANRDGHGRSRPVGTYSLRDLLAKIL